MTNVTVQEALKAAEKLIVKAIMFESEAEQYLSESNYELNGCLGDSAADISVNGKAVLAKVRAALSEIEKCEPVAEAIRERDRLGFAVVNVIGKLDEIIENTQEVEIDDFLHIAVPIDMWNELQAALEDMPKRADLYTSPQPRDWVGLSDDDIVNIGMQNFTDIRFAKAIEAKLKQLNTKG